jgi:hypothetical protein
MAGLTPQSNTDRATRRSLEHHGTWPPPAPPVSIPLDEVHTMVAAIAAHEPMVCLYIEDHFDDEVRVGRIDDVEYDRLSLTEVSPQGEWQHPAGVWMLDDISLLRFGDAYSQILGAIAIDPED